MQNLLYFLYRYGYIILFVLLEIVCFSLVVRFNSHQSGIYLRSSSSVAGWIYDHYSSVVQYWGLTRVATELAEENAWLRKAYLKKEDRNTFEPDSISNRPPSMLITTPLSHNSSNKSFALISCTCTYVLFAVVY